MLSQRYKTNQINNDNQQIHWRDVITQLIYDVSKTCLNSPGVFIILKTAYRTQNVMVPDDIINNTINIQKILNYHLFFGDRYTGLDFKYEKDPKILPDLKKIFSTTKSLNVYCMSKNMVQITVGPIELSIEMPNINNMINYINQFGNVNTITYLVHSRCVKYINHIDFMNTIISISDSNDSMTFIENNTVRHLQITSTNSKLENVIKKSTTIVHLICSFYSDNYLISLLKNCLYIEQLTIQIMSHAEEILHSLLSLNNLHTITISMHRYARLSKDSFLSLLIEKTHINNVILKIDDDIRLMNAIISPHICSLTIQKDLYVDCNTLINLLESNIENDINVRSIIVSGHFNEVYNIMSKYAGHRILSFIDYDYLNYDSQNISLDDQKKLLEKIKYNSEIYSTTLLEYTTSINIT